MEIGWGVSKELREKEMINLSEIYLAEEILTPSLKQALI